MSQWEAFRRDDQGDHHLDTIGALFATVAELPFVRTPARHTKIRASQSVPQYLATHVKQRLPALLQKAEQRRLADHEFIQTPMLLAVLEAGFARRNMPIVLKQGGLRQLA
jgi:hypothetical protein